MADTVVSSAVTEEQWDNDFYEEYIRENQFAPYMGTDINSPIQIKEELTSKPGTRINLELIAKLDGDGVTGTQTLTGNEEALVQYVDPIEIDMLRNGVRVHVFEEKKTGINLRNAGRGALKNWSLDKIRNQCIDRLMSPNLNGTTKYSATSEADKDAWLTANSDRILFGASRSNASSLDHSTSLANVDNTTDKLTAATVSLAKRMAKNATNRAIRPMRVNGMGEVYLLMTNSYCFRDFKNDTVIQNSLQNAWTRGKDNPVFNDNMLYWDGVIVMEVPEIPVIAGAGAGGINVAASFLMGAQALGIAWGMRSKTDTQIDDYNARYGVAVSEIRGIKKLFFDDVQHGMVTMYNACVGD